MKILLLRSYAICYLFCALFCQDVHSQACTRGFIDIDVLERRATKIDSDATGVSSTILSPGRFLAMPGWNFSCSGTITSLVVGVEVRDLHDNAVVIDLWRPSYDSLRVITGYEWVQDAQTFLNFRPGDFTPDGEYQYHIPGSGIQYQSGDIFGVYQSSNLDSPVRVFYTNQLTAPRTFEVDTSYDSTYTIQPSGYDLFTAGTVLVRPISKNEDCMHGFPSESQIRQQILQVNINGVVSRPRTQLIFPDIRFTCHGFITKWIVGAQARSTGIMTEMPELQIWQAHRGTDTYNKTAYSLIIPSHSHVHSHVHEYIPVSPLEVNIGDILGVYQPQVDLSGLVVYNQKWSGPVNYIADGNTPLSTITAVGNGDGYDYPLVAVEMVEDPQADPSTNPSTDPSTDLSTEEVGVDLVSIVVPSVVIPNVVIVIIAVIIIIVILLILFWKKKHKNDSTCPTHTKPIASDQNMSYKNKVQLQEPTYQFIKSLDAEDTIPPSLPPFHPVQPRLPPVQQRLLPVQPNLPPTQPMPPLVHPRERYGYSNPVSQMTTGNRTAFTEYTDSDDRSAYDRLNLEQPAANHDRRSMVDNVTYGMSPFRGQQNNCYEV